MDTEPRQPRFAPYNKDEHCFQDTRTLQVYRVSYCPGQHVSASIEVADAMLGQLVDRVVRGLNAQHPPCDQTLGEWLDDY